MAPGTLAPIGACGTCRGFGRTIGIDYGLVVPDPTKTLAQGAVRAAYFAILGSHTLLAAAIVPLAILTLVHALRGRFPQHRRIARWTWPICIFVSVTGVVIYFMLYHLDPSLRTG